MSEMDILLSKEQEVHMAEEEGEQVVEVQKTKSRLNKDHHELAAWGNYHNYYFHRAPVVPDVRLSLLPGELFANKRVLDLGCNAGKLTLECVTHLGARRALGIDLDEYLIEQARDLAADLDISDRAEFVTGDFMQDSSTYFETLLTTSEVYDTILLLSITKWLHLHHHDTGLLALFHALHAYLPLGGTLIVEPQEWENYKRAVKKNKTLKMAFKGLVMRPPFEEELMGCGFELVTRVEREEGGFSRPLLVWRKV